MSPRVSLLLLSLLLWPASSWANTVQDQMGVGSRAKSMAGAGTASSKDFAATYYNPANLARCATNHVAAELTHLSYGMGTEGIPGEVGELAQEDRSSITLGSCFRLPYKLNLGVVLDTGFQTAQRIDQSSINSRARFAHYGQPLEQLTLMGALSYELNNKLSFGLGGAVLVNSDLALAVQVPVISGDEELASDLKWTLNPTAALYAGLRYQHDDALTLGASVRTSLYHKLDATAFTTVEVAGVLLDVDILLEAVSWYSPLQASLGAEYQFGKRARATADLSWYHLSADPGPYVRISPLDPEDGIAADLNFPPEESFGARDIVIPRVAFELDASRSLQLRTGASYRPSSIDLPTAGQRANLLDGDLATLALGIGYELDPPPLRNANVPKASAASALHIDVHARVHHMAEQSVSKAVENEEPYDYRFGGTSFDLGVTLSAGWD